MSGQTISAPAVAIQPRRRRRNIIPAIWVFIMVGVTMVFFAVVDYVLNYGETLLIGARSLF